MSIERYETPGMLNPVTDSWLAVVREVATLANEVATSDFVPVPFRGKPAQITAAILHGRELGLAPMTALASTHSIYGRVGISAEVMRALITQAGHEVEFDETTTSRCVVRGRRAGKDDWTTVAWTMEDARRAGLLRTVNKDGDRWGSYPRQMLVARATAELARMIFSDVIHGMSAVEELDNSPEALTVSQVGAAPSGESAPTTKVQRAPRKTQQRAVESAPAEQETEPQEPPERLRPELPKRAPQTAGGAEEGEAKAPPAPAAEAGEPRSAPSPDGSAPPASAPVDAEIVNTETGEVTVEDESKGPKLSPGQRASIIMHLQRLGVEDRDERLIYTAFFAGREKLGSTNELTSQQAVKVLAALEKLKDQEALQAALK